MTIFFISGVNRPDMRGRRLVTTQRIVAIVSEAGEAVADDLVDWASTEDIEVAIFPVGASIDAEVLSQPNTIGVTIGGDGTYLEGIKAFSPFEIPVLGVDAGTHPFLVRLDPSDLAPALTEVLRGRATIEPRSQLRIRVDEFDATGLNDVTIIHVEPDRPVDRKITYVEVYIDEEYAGSFPGNGLAVSTPTGSTGIALSGGGPLHYPKNNRTLQITPLLVHDLSVRPIVVDEGVPVSMIADGPVFVSVDGGRYHEQVAAGTPIKLSVAEPEAQLIHTGYDTAYFAALSDRLGWNVRSGEGGIPPHMVASEGANGLIDRALAVAEEAAQSVGGPLRELHGKTESIEYKTDKYDLVTEADYQAERIITSIIESEFPDHNIHSEEDVRRDAGSEYTWIIDPLDGTGNYANGNPNYAVSIGLVQGNDPVVGVVYAPETDELFSATVDGPALRDGKRISTTDRDRLDESVFMSGYDPDGTFLTHFYNVTRGVRRLGSVALHLCYLAGGSCDATWEYDTYPWDTAAGAVIARAAGATLTDGRGEPFEIFGTTDERNELIGSNGPLHPAVLAHLNEHPELGQL